MARAIAKPPALTCKILSARARVRPVCRAISVIIKAMIAAKGLLNRCVLLKISKRITKMIRIKIKIKMFCVTLSPSTFASTIKT